MKEYHFIERFWYPARCYRSFIYYLFWIFSSPFLLLVKLKYFLYKKKFLKSSAFSKPVIVVGNLSVGGTGKTPFIASLVNLLSEQNIKCGVVSRGYHSNVKSYPHQVNDLDNALSVGDEAFMQYSNLRIPIVIDANRSNAVRYLIENNDIDLVISDDGLQHYKMQRDFEIMLMDSSRAFGNKLVMPFGPLREPVSRCQSIDLLVKNGSGAVEHQVDGLVDEQIIMVADNFVNLITNEKIELQTLKGRSVFAVAGIGNPNRFYSTLKNICKVSETKTFKDHHIFRESDFEQLNANADDKSLIIMTEKDAVKCKDFAKNNWYYLEVSMPFNKNLTDDLLSRIQDLIERKGNG
ncbi:MAG: tetraacyldisaccharide 4'-kinase [Polaribacter sp.]|jgi:tetraacyldisaccharide 4'-kinase